MDLSDIIPEPEKNTSSSFEIKNIIYFTLGGLIIAALVILLMFFKNNNETKVEIIPSERKESQSTIIVDIQGAVEKPGVYELASGARLHELLIKAGGLSAPADREWVSKNLNLALKLNDGIKIWIPNKNQNNILNGVSTINTQSLGVTNIEGLVSINDGSFDQLDSLPEVGEKRAKDIIAGRPYFQLDELVSKKIITKSLFEKLKDKISL